MKKILFVFSICLMALLTISTPSCKNGEKEENPLADSLSGENANLKGQLTSKEQALQEFVNAFNDITANLNEIKAKEKVITNSAKSGDVKSQEEQIKEDIQAIYELMAKNKSRVNSLNKKLKAYGKKIQGLEQMIANLEAQLNEKDVQINDLKNTVENLNIELSNLTLNYEELMQETEVKTEKLNTAFYAIGSSKELIEKGVITKEGGVIGIGKTATLKADFNKEYFTKVNINDLSSLPLGAKKVKILTTHPAGSYKLYGEKPVEKLEITDTENFWSVSKYLVIIVEN